MDEFATFLYARPSAAEGAARILDFSNSLSEYNQSITGAQADFLALSADWHLIGEDMKAAILRHLRESSGVQKVESE